MAAGGKSDGSSSDAASLDLPSPHGTVALCVASAAMMASASQHSCTGCSPATASHACRYCLAANVISAATWLTARRKEDESKAAKSLSELVDTGAQVLLYSSSALSFSMDDFSTRGRRCLQGLRRVLPAGTRVGRAVSVAAAVEPAASKYLKDVPAGLDMVQG